ncbi:type ISP restriction/modification enzyme [Mycobacteroides abscessus subsp. abscessus]|uniref:type ISP restriction/modification enzyme n=1 Tax=Mycobacteroides abscessus TaxID=36809 RepID=UPI0039EFB0E4
MPDTVHYDPQTQTIHLGAGTFGPVPQQVWDYTVGGKNVIRAWVNYRKKTPTGRQTSPLDTVHVGAWPSDWNSEFIDLLSVLTHLTALHPQQCELLEQILEHPTASRTDLTTLGVTWPTTATDKQRRPDAVAPLTEDDPGHGQLGLTF